MEYLNFGSEVLTHLWATRNVEIMILTIIAFAFYRINTIERQMLLLKNTISSNNRD
jgi:hypothetical protein